MFKTEVCTMKKRVIASVAKQSLTIISAALLLAACGDEVTQINQTGLEVYSAEKDLPECTEKNEGDQAVVKGETSIRVCIDGDWTTMNSENSGADFSCKTVELKDGSGLKIVCNGDSIGVVLNGSDGKDGKAGKDGSDGEDGKAGTGCAMTDKTDSTVTVKCGDSTMVIELGVGASADTAEADSERVPISLDSIVGLTQKGPFLKGSTVYLYELSDGRTLKQTNGNFTSNISQENGRYKFLARDLVSQYAMVIVDGYYRNEVTGVSSNAPIRLKAITDMRKRSSVNVNILTHLEFERVYYLVTKEKYTVKQAKRKAQREILNFFGINLDGNADAENMDVFGSSDADAALLAVSILLQGDRTESDMMALLSEMSAAMAEDGVWDNDRAKAVKAELADWAFGQQLSKFRTNVENWHLGDGKVGDFEKYIYNFIAETFEIEECGDEASTKKLPIKNKSSRFYGKSFECFREPEWEKATWVEILDNPYLDSDGEDVYFTRSHMIDWRDRRMYRTELLEFDCEEGGTSRYWMVENLDFDYRVNGKSFGNRCYEETCLSDSSRAFGRYYSWAAAMDSAGIYSEDGKNCGYENSCSARTPARGICPEGWHLPDTTDWSDINKAGCADEVSRLFRSKNGWIHWELDETDGTNDFGLSVIPTGYIYADRDSLMHLGREADFWTYVEESRHSAYYFEVYISKTQLSRWAKSFGRNIRCVK